MHKEHREKYEGKHLHGQFTKATEEVRSKRSWDWLKKVTWRKKLKHYRSTTRPGPIYKEFEKCGLQRKCSVYLSCMWCCWWSSCAYCFRMLKNNAERVQTSETWQSCQKCFIGSYAKNGFNKAEKWYIHKPKKVLESENCKIFWNFPIQNDKTLENSRPDITVDKKSKKCILIDLACQFDTRIEKKEEEKCTNYCELNYEISKIWKMRKVEAIPLVIGALRTVTKHFEKWIEKLDLGLAIEVLQKPSLLGVARIIGKVFNMK